jgi:hypothetical protein
MDRLPDLSLLSHDEKDALIHALWAQIQALTAQVGILTARVAELEDETGLSRPSPDRAAQLARLLGLKPSEVSASERGSAKKTVDLPRSVSAQQGVSRVSGAKVPSRDEGAVLDALRAMPAAERRVMMRLVLACGGKGSRAVTERRR